MTYDTNKLSFPKLNLPSMWNEDSTWFTALTTPSGLSLSEDEDKVYIEAALPGIDPKNIDVTIHDGYLWIRGEVKEEENKSKKYYRKASKSFSYRVEVPDGVDGEDPQATYKHGVMTVAFNKSPKTQQKKIQVKEEN